MVHPIYHAMVDVNGMIFKQKQGHRYHANFEWTYGSIDAHGYRRVQLRLRSDPSIRKNVQVHRLVAECFIANPFGKKTVDHIDRNPLNNSVTNLRWFTQAEQCLNTSRHLHVKYGVHYNDSPEEYKHNYYMEHKAEKLNYDRMRREAMRNGTWTPSRRKAP